MSTGTGELEQLALAGGGMGGAGKQREEVERRGGMHHVILGGDDDEGTRLNQGSDGVEGRAAGDVVVNHGAELGSPIAGIKGGGGLLIDLLAELGKGGGW